jgi:hypothetical protein
MQKFPMVLVACDLPAKKERKHPGKLMRVRSWRKSKLSWRRDPHRYSTVKR